MTFNDTTNRNGLIQSCEFLCSLQDAGISGDTNLLKHFTRLINARCYQVLTMILNAQDEWDFDDVNLGNYPTATRALIVAQRDYRFDTASWSLIGREGGSAASNAAIKPLKIKRVDITYDGTNYYKAEPFDEGETGLGLGNDTNTDQRFGKTKPFYDVRDYAIWLYPTASSADVTAGAKMRITFVREFDEFTSSDTTQEPGFDEPFHQMAAVGASLDYAVAKGLSNKNDLAAMWADYENRLRVYYGNKQKDRELILKPSYVNYE